MFKTSIFADRFYAVSDTSGTSFLSVDGVYFRELDLTYRLLQGDALVEEVILRHRAEIDSACLGVDHEGRRHILWLERSPEINSVNYTALEVPYAGMNPLSCLKPEIDQDGRLSGMSPFMQSGRA